MQNFSQLSPRQRESLVRFRQETVMFPKFEEAYQSILESLTMYRETGLVDTKAIYGEAGCGKTTVCKVIEGNNPRIVELERDIVPVLYTSIPALATISSVAEALLAKLGDPLPSRGTNSSKTERLIALIQKCTVDIVILDELQHVNDRGQSPTLYKVGDWIKNLVDRINRPVVLVGLPRAEALGAANEQLRRRFGASLTLDRLTLENSETASEFVDLASALLDALPVRCSLDIQSYADVERLYYATDGRIGYLSSLFQRALILTFKADRRLVDDGTLEAAFTAQIWREGVGQLNPFHADFCMRRLDKAGEPFGNGMPVRSTVSRRSHGVKLAGTEIAL